MASRYDGFKREEEEDVDEEYNENFYKSQKDAVIFAIAVSESMLERPPPSKSKKADKDSAVSAALRCAYQIMQQRIIAQPKDLMGILFFGTDKSKFRDPVKDEEEEETQDKAVVDALAVRTTTAYPHCYLFMDLDVPAAEDVRALKNLVEEEDDPDEVLTPTTKTVSMANVLFCANQIFTTNAANFGSRRLFIITDDDDPHRGDKSARAAAAVRAKDLYDLGVNIELFPIGRGDGVVFDLTKFYDDIIYRDPTAEAGQADNVATVKTGDGLTLLSSLISNISAKQTPKRSYFSNLTFEIAPGLDISVKGYILLSRQKPARSCYVAIDGDSPQLATSETVRVDSESTRTVDAGEIKKAYKFGGEFVYFAPDELKALKQWEFPADWKGKGLRIIGFKPRVMLPPWASVKRSTFIYPSEDDYVGSTRVFSALWQKLRGSDKVAIAWFVARTNANPLLVAIIPSDGPEGEDGEIDPTNPMHLPAGLWLYPLPFAEDIRKFDDSRGKLPASEKLTELMKPIVENLFLPKMTYNPTKYPNPALQWHYKILQTVALEETVPTTGEDATLPKYRTIDKRVGGSLAEFKEVLQTKAVGFMTARAGKRGGGDDDDDGGKKPLAKRPKTSSSSGSGAAKAAPGAMTDAQLRKAVDDDKLSALSVAALKNVLSSKKLSMTGKKADLVERLEEWVEENL